MKANGSTKRPVISLYFGNRESLKGRRCLWMERMLQSGIKDSVFSSGCFVEVVICAVGEAVTGAEWEQARQTKPDKQDGEGTETETVRTSSSTASHHLLWDDDEREVLNVKEEKKTPDLMCHLLKLIKAELLSKKKSLVQKCVRRTVILIIILQYWSGPPLSSVDPVPQRCF